MGSASFVEVYRGGLSLDEAYNELVEQALSEYGHNPYNGTISTTRGVRLVDAPPMTIGEAQALADTRLDALSKWEACEAIRLKGETEPEYEILPPVRITTTVSGHAFNSQEVLLPTLTKAAKLAKNVEIYDYTFDRTSAVVEKQVSAEAPKEKTETRYFILRGHDHPNMQMQWDKGFPSQAAARAALTTILLYNWKSIPPVNAEIVGVTRRVSGAPLVKATVSAKKVSGTFELKVRRIVKPAKPDPKLDGYYIFGWAAE